MDLQHLGSNKIFLSVPTRGSIQWTTVMRLNEIRDLHPGLPPVLYAEGHVSEPLTRNSIVQHFLGQRGEVLVMVDDDVVPPPDLLDAVRHLEDFDMVGIPYPMMIGDQLELTIFQQIEGGYGFVEPENGVHECDAVGGGCMLIHRRVFEKLGDVPFRMGHDPRLFVTADLLFCMDVKAAGLKIGYVWNDLYADHNATVSLGPLKQMQALLMSSILPEHDPFAQV